MESFRYIPAPVFWACLFIVAMCGLAPASELPPTGALAPTEARSLMDSLGSKLTVLDVRTEQEFAQGHVPGALLFPLQTLRETMNQVPVDGPVLILCRTGRRAEAAYDLIRAFRPGKKDLWFLKGEPLYGNNGAVTFK